MKTSESMKNTEESAGTLEFIRRLPKAELHLHLEGTVGAETLIELSRRHPTPMPVENYRYQPDPASGEVLDAEKVRSLFSYSDFTGFLMAFKAVTERMRTAEDYELVTYDMARKLAEQNVLHAEVFVSVGVVQWRGQAFEPLYAGMERGRTRAEKEFGTSLIWIFDAVRHFGVEEGKRVVELALALRNRELANGGASAVAGFGIGGDERRTAAAEFAEIYRHAADGGLRLTAHAGEAVGAESIWGAINVGAERLGHALHAVDDAELMEHLAETQIPVEACISSNMRTGCCLSLAEHPVRRMFEEGLMVTLNTDDPALFSTTLTREYQIAHETFGFSEDDLREVARNSFEASFLPAEKKLEFLRLCDEN